MLHLDDLAVGQRYVARGSRTLDAQAIKDFAREYDPQAFHLDEAAALDSPFQGLAASGWQIAGITMRLLVDGGMPLAGGMIGAGAELSWPRPTRPGDRLHAACEVIAIAPSRSKPDRGIVTIRCETFNQHDEVVQLMVSKLMVRRDPARLPPA
ncbi:MaoC family dehydratase [soil metagenome]